MRSTLALAAALTAVALTPIVSVTARADIPPPHEQVSACVEAAITRRIVAKESSLGPAPCRVVGPFAGASSSPGEAAGQRDNEQKREGYTWICPLTSSYRESTLYCKLPAGMTAEDALGGAEPGPAGELGKGRGCGSCDAGRGPTSPASLSVAGLAGLAGLAVARRRRA